ncbi:hypothetical protein C8R44DRAFT_865957 [Mycena epipterygia]|nr:hypothetical protein C8R44DRAFT_865957 [Mycena epipterygia]
MSISTTLLPIAQRLPNLRRLTVRCEHGSPRGKVVVATVWACIQRPSLRCVELDGLHAEDVVALLTILTGSPTGRKLSCLRISRETHNSLAVDALDLSSQFEWASERHLVDLLSRSRPLLKMLRLRRLQLTAGDDLKFIGYNWTPWILSSTRDDFPLTARLELLHSKFTSQGRWPQY